jgi:hypoxanthine phosphoribosyltransferase
MQWTIDTSQTGKILIDAQSITESISRLAEQIKREFKQSKRVSVIVLLEGARRFADDLFKLIDDDRFILNYINVKSYSGTQSSGEIQVNGNLSRLNAEDVLIIDDIYDSGKTMHHMLDIVTSHDPSIVKTCVFMKKQVSRDHSDLIDFYCFDIPDTFVVGYGLDHDGQYRDLPYIAQLDT